MSFDRMMPLIVFFSEEKTVRGIDRLVAASAQIEYSRLRRAKQRRPRQMFATFNEQRGGGDTDRGEGFSSERNSFLVTTGKMGAKSSK